MIGLGANTVLSGVVLYQKLLKYMAIMIFYLDARLLQQDLNNGRLV